MKLRQNAFIILIVIMFLSSVSLSQEVALVQKIAEGTTQEIRALIARGVDINQQNDLGWTPLHAAVMFGKEDVIDVLLASDADLNIKDNAGKTPLFIAVESGQEKIVNILLDKKPDINIVNNNNDNALSVAQKVGLTKIASVLQENGATMPGQEETPNLGMPQDMRGMRQGRGGMPGFPNGMPQEDMRGMRQGRGGVPGFPNGMPGQGMMNRGGMPPAQVTPSPDVSVNNDDEESEKVEIDPRNLDPNDVQARIKEYSGLQEQILEVAAGSKSSLSHWGKEGRDNRTSLISAIRRQYDDEVEFIENIAAAEEATQTSELAHDLRNARKKIFIDIKKEVQDADTPTRTTSNRRVSSRTTSRTQEEEEKYSPEVQSEIDDWVRADVEEIRGRMTLMDSVNEVLVSEIVSIRESAAKENAEKTIAAIDGLLLARRMGFDGVKDELQKIEEEQQDIMERQNTDTDDTRNTRDTRDTRDARGTTGRGMRRR